MTAAVHGLTEIADSLALKLGDNLPTLTPGKKSSFIMPPPICRNGDWLLLRVTKGIFEGGLDNAGVAVHEEEDEGAAANRG
jgi:coatomer protein complex subunit alpha (xenin)